MLHIVNTHSPIYSFTTFLKPVLLDEKHTTQSHYYRKAFDVAINVLREGGGQFA
jgi:hypothetical protein